MAADDLWQRSTLEASGTVVSRETTVGNRPVTRYVLREDDGGSQTLLAGPTDASLPRSLPVGTQIDKRKYQLSWSRNGTRVDDFPLAAHMGMFGVAAGCALWGLLLWRGKRAVTTPARV